MSKKVNKITKKLFVLVAVLVIVISVIGVWRYGSGGKFSYDFNWEKGKIYVYSLTYNTTNSTVFSMDPNAAKESQKTFFGGVDLKCNLRLKAYGMKGKNFLLGVSFDKCELLNLNVMGSSLFKTPSEAQSAFTGEEGLILVTSKGAVKELRFKAEAENAFKNVVQNIIAEVQVNIVDGSLRWKVQESSQHGEALSAYAVKEENWRDVKIVKKRTKYETLNALGPGREGYDNTASSNYKISLNTDGHIDSLSGRETISATNDDGGELVSVKTSVSMTLLRIEEYDDRQSRAAFARFSSMSGRSLGEIVISDRARQRALIQRAAGMKIENLVGDLLKYGNLGEMPFNSQWTWRAAGLLRLKPKECWKLVDVFKNPTINVRGKKSIIELLVSTGHGVAQKVMRKLLLSEEAQSTGRSYNMMLQRAMLLTEPNNETGEFMYKMLTDSADTGEDLHLASAVALAGIANSMRKNGQLENYAKYNDALVSLLQNAEKGVEKVTYLRALGNVADENNVEIVVPYKDDENFEVRQSVAAALRNTQTKKSTQIVLELAGDDDSIVQNESLLALKDYDMDTDNLKKLQGLLEKDSLKSFNYGSMFNVLSKNYKSKGETHDKTRELLMMMLDKEKLGAGLRYKIRNMIGE